MACRAGAGAATCAFHLEVVGLGNVEQVVALADFEGIRLAVFVDECDVQPTALSAKKDMYSHATLTLHQALACLRAHGGRQG